MPAPLHKLLLYYPRDVSINHIHLQVHYMWLFSSLPPPPTLNADTKINFCRPIMNISCHCGSLSFALVTNVSGECTFRFPWSRFAPTEQKYFFQLLLSTSNTLSPVVLLLWALIFLSHLLCGTPQLNCGWPHFTMQC